MFLFSHKISKIHFYILLFLSVCDSDHWGMNCSTPCDCQNNAECDPEKGCICQDGWKGTKCSEDINECDNVNNCTNIQTCINKKGSYDCECIAGYRKEGNGCVGK